MKFFTACLLLALLLSLTTATDSLAFSANGCDSNCKQCHILSREDVNKILKNSNLANAKILDIQISPVKGLWEVSLDSKGNRVIMYVDFSKQYIVQGPIIEIVTGSDRTREQLEKIKVKKKIDVSKIPLGRALVVGKAGRKNAKKVIVFTDPDCPFCGQFHREIKKVVQERKDIVFYIKLYPLEIHKDAYWKSKSIVCENSLKMLEDNFDAKPIAKVECNTKEIDNNIKLAGSLGISGTPAFILPNGVMHGGAMPASKLIELIDGRQ